ncbi:alpha-catulin isoform X2 [Phymastichus coffea]|uniref:alpha-catulin isoform X2 n=1 Tax=Phymastichus coffea TaxID=108790 RepID=UPI00273CB81F|nr:alpha-catulin isoform X2 [Phymastichus coffea]
MATEDTSSSEKTTTDKVEPSTTTATTTVAAATGIACTSSSTKESNLVEQAAANSSLDFKSRSIEQVVLPLVSKISKLVSHRDRPFRCERNPGMLARVGQGVNLAVERFVTVAETIADDNLDVKADMYEACKEARVAGTAIEKLCECAMEECLTDREAVVRAAKCLLGAVTRVLLLADITVVKQLLMAKDKVARSLGRLESVSNFTEFVKAFSQFGAEMVELAHMTGDRQNDLKDERRRAQMAAARQVLERSTMMLLTSSKACLRHPDCATAKENRDTVFCQMRRAMDLIHYVVKDGVLDCSGSDYLNSQEDWDSSTVFSALKQFERLVESTRVTLLSAGCRETLTSALDVVVERTQDFTDSAYTSHEHRENILLLCDRAKLELNTLLRIGNSMNFDSSTGASPNSELDQAVLGVLRATRDLRHQLCQTTMEQAGDLNQVTKAGQELVSTIRNFALTSDMERLQECSDRFHEYIEHILEVCKLLRHIALTESLQVSAKFTEINLRIYGPQVVTAAHTLSRHPTSKIAIENLEVFADMWQWLMSDVTTVAKDVLELCQNRPEKQVYMSLPRPGKHGTTSKPLKPVRLDSEEQAKIAKAGLEMKRITSEMEAETEKWQENGSALEENNDIVKRAKNMSSMAFSMYQFTRGEGALKTTQDLFTQAEYFAEEANRLYKVVRQFSYQVHQLDRQFCSFSTPINWNCSESSLSLSLPPLSLSYSLLLSQLFSLTLFYLSYPLFTNYILDLTIPILVLLDTSLLLDYHFYLFLFFIFFWSSILFLRTSYIQASSFFFSVSLSHTLRATSKTRLCSLKYSTILPIHFAHKKLDEAYAQ